MYNHIESQSDLLAEVGICAVNMLTGLEEASIADKLRDEALFSLANAYRRFAREHTELYRIIMGVHTLDIPLLESEAEKIDGNAAFCHAYGNCKFVWNRGFQPDFTESWNRRQGKSEKMCCFQHMERRCYFLFVWHYNVSDMSGYLPVAWHGREYIWLLFQLCTMDDYDWRDP